MTIDPTMISLGPDGAPKLSGGAAAYWHNMDVDTLIGAAMHAASNPGCQNAGDCKGTTNDGNCSNDLQCGGSSNDSCHNVGSCFTDSNPPTGP